MARKVRRVKRPSSRNDSTEKTTGPSPQTPSEEMLREEYAYVLQDLRRVFILAAIMFALLIALNVLL